MSIGKILLPLGFAVSLVNGLGCYNGAGFMEINSADFTFSMLHSDSNQFGSAKERDIRGELLGDITAFCKNFEGSKVARGQAQDQCTDWAYEDYNSDCKKECLKKCPYVPGGTEPNCDDGQACLKECPMEVIREDNASVYYKVAHDHKDDEVRTMTSQICYDGFAKGSEDCARGGESEYEGFWFKIDPNPLKCDAKGIFKRKI